MKSSTRIVLVRTEVAGNLGAVARVMHNFGLNDLVLVAPKADPNAPEAMQRSTHAATLLAGARQVESLDAALAGCRAAAAASARTDGIYRRDMVMPPDAAIANLLEVLPSGPIALVFGPEPSGLTTAEITRCDYLINIPTTDEAPALNLSHAVAICVYELARQLATTGETGAAIEPPAPDEDRERMFVHLRRALEDVHYLWDEKADLLFHGLRQMICRSRPTTNDVRILHGLARQLEWVVRNRYRIDQPSD